MMKKAEIIALFKKTSNKYQEAQMACSKQQELCDGLRQEIGFGKSGLEKRLARETSTLKQQKERIDIMRTQYASDVLDKLNEICPTLLIRVSKEKIKWTDAFGATDKDKLSADDIRALIALIEEDGGRYRIME